MTEASSMEDICVRPSVYETRSTVSNSPLSHVQLACTHKYCAFPWNKNELCIWDTANQHAEPMILKGHHQPITAVAIKQNGDQWLACSASQDYVITWNLNDCTRNVLQGLIPHGLVIGTLMGDVQHLAFHSNEKLVVTCAGTRVFILHSQREEILAELTIHQGLVNGAEFWLNNFLVCISEDRTFSIWDYHSGHLVFQSGIISAFPLLKMYIDEENEQLVTGCADGMLRAFSLVKGHNFRCLCNIDLRKEKLKFYRRFERSGQSERSEMAGTKSLGNEVDSGLPILHIMKYRQQLPELYMPLLGNPALMCIGSSTDILLTNMATSEVEAVLHYEDYDDLSIYLAGSISMSFKTGKKDFCLIASMFESHISLLEFDTCALWRFQQHKLLSCAFETNLSIVSSNPLLSTSPLCSHVPKKSANAKTNVLQTKTKDQPLVFNNKIKSSGYTAAPRMKMFSPKTNFKKIQFSAVRKEVTSEFKKEYPVDSAAPSNLQRQITLSNRPTSVGCIQYSGDGMKLACGLSDKSLLVFSSTLKGEPAVFTGHDGAINGLGWSYNRNWLVSTSDDRTVRIWNAKTTALELVLGKEMFSRPVRFPQFYYMDTFILLASGAEIHLMKYHLDNSKNDLKRYEQKSVCKTVEKFHLDSVEITGISAVNDFYSHIVLAAGTNHTVEVFDLNVGRRVTTIPDVHSRAAHQICQNKGSAFSTQPTEAYNLFVTMAIGDSLKLWDIRTLRCVRHFEGHVNRHLPCGVAISPCGRFIACGSEDRCAYIYETRFSTYLEKLKEHTESVINVAFSPSTAQLTTCTVDGTLQMFSS
ncbi:PREDICTED: WD repeat-containing protein 27 [Nanorana parkeri]|uniref:WD repeat-containing protein 27 n=1 Tax=Nanorana parkeri TaxID=125878 RepID=UPI0008548C8C|nr:PREDICTED: WD repeat-containing protein 27 [Nanorana parkeri]